ncbi:hypothetical protein [Xylanibacter brevis]|uniref:hypothetical protein n=1 Tax=Xylanibacter brevis TaxID=83231 RepID=UPI000485DD2B|nr:hypothetical protein [Xylanibacter brevis]
MDYIETFKNLRTNNKYGRKSPHKAILMLAVIELYEQNVLTNNEIFYDDKLKSMFLKVWNRVLPNETLFHPDAYMPFWYLQSDCFWHIVPFSGKEDILSLMRDVRIKPSEAKLIDSVKYAELDEDLYFLMTIASGRSSLKRTLLETYTSLSEEQIDGLSGSVDNSVDYSLSAMNEYEQIISSVKNDEKVLDNESSSELVKRFRELSDNIQIALNYEYYAFLKNRQSERDMLREVCPNVYTLFDCITNHPVQRTDISPSFAFIYDNFLSDLKIALMSENGSMDLIDKIDSAIAILRGHDVSSDSFEKEKRIDSSIVLEKTVSEEEKNIIERDLEVEHVFFDSGCNIVKTVTTSSLKYASEKEIIQEGRKGKAWTPEEEERITHYYERGISTADIAERVGRTELAIKARLAKLGLIEYTYGQDESKGTSTDAVPVNLNEYKIENGFTNTCILNKQGEKVFSTTGKLKQIGGKIYRLNLKDKYFTIKDMKFNGEVWIKGNKKIVAYLDTELYQIMNTAYDYSEAIEDLFEGSSFEECKLKANGVWFNYQGDQIPDSSIRDNAIEELPKQHQDCLRIIEHPLYVVRKQAILRAMGYFRLPARIRDIARTISRTAWGAAIKEKDVEDIISTIDEIESVDDRYILKKR